SAQPERELAAEPLALYYLDYYSQRVAGKTPPPAASHHYGAVASHAEPARAGDAFPFQYEAIPILRHAMEANPHDARAPYYLGSLLFDWQPVEAVKLWEQSEALDPSIAMVHRDLGVAYSHLKPTND